MSHISQPEFLSEIAEFGLSFPQVIPKKNAQFPRSMNRKQVCTVNNTTVLLDKVTVHFRLVKSENALVNHMHTFAGL